MRWGVYAAICGVVPLLWGLAVYWFLRRLPERRRDGSPLHPQEEAGTGTVDYHI